MVTDMAAGGGEIALPEVVPVFGALRSGTTLFRLMLAAHGRIANPGEADFLFDYLRRDPSHPTGWRYNVSGLADDRIFQDSGLTLPAERDGLDLLANLLGQYRSRAPEKVLTLNLHRNAERLRAILPGVRVIHLLRDPRDVARSSIQMGWAGTTWHGVGHWLATEAGWDRAAIPPEQVLTLSYEALFEDIEGSLSRVCGFLGLPYAPQMLEYWRNTTYGPPDARLTWQWRRNATPQEIALVEARAGALMQARGYALSGDGWKPGAVGRLRLNILNKLRVWHFLVRRFGLGDVLAEKVTRRLGLIAAWRRINQRMNETARQHLK